MSPRKPGQRLQSAVTGTTLIGIALTHRLQSLIQRVVPGEVHFRMAASIEELSEVSASATAPVLVYSLPNGLAATEVGSPSLREVLELHEALSRGLRAVPAMALCSAAQVDTSVVASLRALNHVQLVTLDAPDPYRALWFALERLLAARISTVLLHSIGELDSLLIRKVMGVALGRAGASVQVSDLAKALHMHERTLRRRLREEAGSLTPQELIGWARVFLAAWHLRERHRPVVDIANALSFSAASNLHRAVKQYTGVSIKDLRSGEPVAIVASRFRSAVARSTSPSRRALVSKCASSGALGMELRSAE